LGLVKYFPEPARVYTKRGIEFEVRPITHMVSYFKRIHNTRTMREITEIFQKETRTDAENEFLCKQQLLCNLSFIYIYSNTEESIERITRIAPEHRPEWQISVLEAFNKEQRTDEEDKKILNYVLSVNERIHEDFNKQIERGW